ncbi:MAG: hypothetical protein HFJ94_04425 [Muribaculaceae bacterium]|nr:hypothetical protein [Muribaculaceae bacterium]
MKGIRILLLLIASVTFPVGVEARGVKAVADSLSRLTDISVPVRFTVAMPQLTEDVIYNIGVTCRSTADTLLFPCSYLIDWSIEGRTPEVRGFAAYYEGNHYRFSGDKLQEYHASSDSVPFMPKRFGAMSSDGVQQSAQFVNILPVSIADALRKMAADSCYTIAFTEDTVVGGVPSAVVKAVMVVGGQTAMESEYVLDRDSFFPRRIHFENSPGSVSEQTADVEFGTPASPEVQITEPALIELYPDVFAKMRRSSFSLEKLVGQPLPGFNAPTPTGERYSRRAGDHFASPTVIAIIDPSVSFAPDAVASLRRAVSQAPVECGLVMAFTSTNADLIEEVAGTPAVGEAILQSARGVARDMGAAQLPAVLLVKKDSTVADVIVGYNKDLASDVIQKMALLNQ